jgi:hypothetical protein
MGERGETWGAMRRIECHVPAFYPTRHAHVRCATMNKDVPMARSVMKSFRAARTRDGFRLRFGTGSR